MSKNTKAIVSLATLTALGLVVFYQYNKKKNKKEREMMERVAEEGYEFAHDVLYPLKRNRLKRFL